MSKHCTVSRDDVTVMIAPSPTTDTFGALSVGQYRMTLTGPQFESLFRALCAALVLESGPGVLRKLSE